MEGSKGFRASKGICLTAFSVFFEGFLRVCKGVLRFKRAEGFKLGWPLRTL